MTSKNDCDIIILIKVATYNYDAWGNILSMSGSMAEVNPFRYRGYYYDTESGFYYLQTRYYDPTIRQFINADNYELLPTLSQTIGQLNLYAYANNNPIAYTDETGESFIATFLVSLAINVISGTIDGIITTALSEGNVWIGALAGATSGVLATLFGFNNPYLARAIGSVSSNLLNTWWQNGAITTSDIIYVGEDLILDMLSFVFYGYSFEIGGSENIGSIIRGVVDISVDTTQTYVFNKISDTQKSVELSTNEGWKKLYWVGL